MVTTLHVHDCDLSATEHLATAEQPYHYVGSGLRNVYLIGVKYWKCEECGMQSAEIPALTQLLSAIARVIVEKQSPLNGSQVRYLRKRLSRQSQDFAALIGVTPERYSAIEASDKSLAEGRDKLVRMIYRVLSGDRKLKNALEHEDQLEKWLMAIHGRGASEEIRGTWLGSRKWRVEAAPMALCA